MNSRNLLLLGCAVVLVLIGSGLGSTAKEVGAAFEPRIISFRVELNGETPVVVGTVPVGRRLILKDFLSIGTSTFTSVLEVRADGRVVAAVQAISGGGTLGTNLSAGIAIEGGQELAFRWSRFDESPTVTIAGVVE